MQAAGQELPLATQIGLLALMVIAKWQSERDEEKFQETLRSPAKVERATDRALAGAAA